MAGVAAGVLTKQIQSRICSPSAVVWSTNGPLAFNAQDTSSCLLSNSSRMASSSSSLKSPLNHAPISNANLRSGQFGNGSSAAASPRLEPAVPSSGQVSSRKPTTLYDVLGISYMVTDDDIKAAFRRIAKEVHPDQAPPGKLLEYQKRFVEAHQAYSVLKNPQTRAFYNVKIRNSLQGTKQGSKQFRAEDWRRPKWRGCNWETDQCWTL